MNKFGTLDNEDTTGKRIAIQYRVWRKVQPRFNLGLHYMTRFKVFYFLS